MIAINYKTELQNYNPTDRSCMIMLYGIAMQDGMETGRFMLDKKFISGSDYDLYVNQANQTIEANFLKVWEDSIISPMKDLMDQFVKDSNSGEDLKGA